MLGPRRAPCGVTPPRLAEEKSLSGLHSITPGADSRVESCCWAAGPGTGLPGCWGRSGIGARTRKSCATRGRPEASPLQKALLSVDEVTRP